MLRRAALVLIAVASSYLTFMVIIAVHPYEGRVILTLTAGHGVHIGDLPVVGAWLVCLTSCGVLWRHEKAPAPDRRASVER